MATGWRAAGLCVALLWGLAVLPFVAGRAGAQSRFDHWTAQNGLPQNSVRAVVQTRDGYLWFTTFDGLVRFDGVRFTVFNKSNSPGLPSNRFVRLFEDRFGDLWATLEGGEVVRRREGRFSTCTQAHGLPSERVPNLWGDDQGNVVVRYLQWIADGPSPAYTRLVSRAYRWSTDRFEPAGDLDLTFSELPTVVGEAKGLTYVGEVERDFWITSDRHVFRLMRGGGARVYDEHSGLPGTQPGLIRQPGRPMQAVTRDREGRLWLTDLESMRSELLSSQSPEGFIVNCGYADGEGNYWFGTYNNGLFRARRQAVTPYGRAQGLTSSEAYPLLEARDGTLYIGTAGGGVFRLENGAFTQYPASTPMGVRTFTGYPNTLYEDRAGQMWADGFWRLVDGRFVREPWTSGMVYPEGGAIWTMCEDREGAYWYGTNVGAVRYRNGTATEFTTKDGLAGDDTKVIVEDGEGGIWLGSYGGLTHYKHGKFTAWTERDGLPGSAVRALKIDADGTVWIGTYDSGLARFKDGRFTSYTTRDGLFDNGVFQILEDDAGRFWMSCNRGIYRVRKQELVEFAEGRARTITSLAYDESDGMPSSECNGGRWPAGVRTRDGRLWFPTMGGVAMIDPTAVRGNTQPPPVVVEAMRIDNEPVPFDAWDAAVRDPRSAIEIQPGQDNFEIEYTALSFVNSENMRFRYMLEGADDEWVDAGTRRTAYFSRVAPGEYTFRVIAANADGVWNDVGAGVRVTVVPPFWRTWWFVSLVTAAVVGAALVWHGRRLARLRREHAAQEEFSRRLMESQENERQRIAAELHDSLGQSLAIIKNRALLGLRRADDDGYAVEQLREISDAAAEVIDEVKEIAHNLRPYQLDRLGLTKAIEGMINKVAETHDLRFVTNVDSIDGLLPSAAEINVFRIVQESINNVVKHAEATEVEVRVARRADAVEITVRDDGRGFAPEAPGRDGGRRGFGLIGMQERARQLGGAYSLRSAPGRGTTMTLTIELKDVTRES